MALWTSEFTTMKDTLRVKVVEAQWELPRDRSHIFGMGRFERQYYVGAIYHHEREHKTQMSSIWTNMLEVI